ncbi:type II secretion system F family protein [Paenibacillus xanthanilyticus]|uniref:Type II secretion system F family protein n=1 Tax=Paenibacillus xanthanilyticus TaxID=1783531 RepID=A0ABV8K8E2_9BACL
MVMIWACLLAAGWGACALMAQRLLPVTSYEAAKLLDGGDAQRKLLALSFRYALERLGMYDRLQLQLGELHGKLLIVKGSTWSLEATRLHAASAVGVGYAAACIGAGVGAAGDEPVICLLGLLLGVLLPVVKWREPAKLVERRKQDMLIALPDVLSKLTLLLAAGETMQRALTRCIVRVPGKPDHPLHEELAKACEAVRNGESFAAAMESFSRRCALQEVSLFTTTLLLNYRRGGDKLVLSLKELTYSLWERRKAIARSRGEEASSKLVFPLVGIFVVLMMLVASPAVLLMGW